MIGTFRPKLHRPRDTEATRCGFASAVAATPESTLAAVAGYSQTPLAKKLGLKPGLRLLLVGAPSTWRDANIASDVLVVSPRSKERADVAIAFFTNRSSLAEDVEALATRITPSGALWLAWPRGAGGHLSDITDNEVRRIVLPLGLVDTKVAALDDDWSGLKFVWRKERRGSLG